METKAERALAAQGELLTKRLAAAESAAAAPAAAADEEEEAMDGLQNDEQLRGEEREELQVELAGIRRQIVSANESLRSGQTAMECEREALRDVYPFSDFFRWLTSLNIRKEEVENRCRELLPDAAKKVKAKQGADKALAAVAKWEARRGKCAEEVANAKRVFEEAVAKSEAETAEAAHWIAHHGERLKEHQAELDRHGGGGDDAEHGPEDDDFVAISPEDQAVVDLYASQGRTDEAEKTLLNARFLASRKAALEGSDGEGPSQEQRAAVRAAAAVPAPSPTDAASEAEVAAAIERHRLRTLEELEASKAFTGAVAVGVAGASPAAVPVEPAVASPACGGGVVPPAAAELSASPADVPPAAAVPVIVPVMAPRAKAAAAARVSNPRAPLSQKQIMRGRALADTEEPVDKSQRRRSRSGGSEVPSTA